MNNKVILSFLLLFSSILSWSQTEDDFAFLLKVPAKTEVKGKSIQKDKNELEVTIGLLFGLYQNFLSTQDGSTCSFYPSCSRYCKHAMATNGIIKGGIQGLDRLVRCNGLSPRKYVVDLERRKLVDHVK